MREEEIKLLKSARDKEPKAIDKILMENKRLVVSIARKYFLIGGDQEDLIQEGMGGLFKAICSFDVEKNDSFYAYAKMLIEREIISAIRRANSGGQQPLSESILIDNDDELGDDVCPESDFIHEKNTLELTNEIMTKLSPFEKIVVDYFLKGYKYTDIAKMTGKSSKSVDNALSRIKNKLEYLKERL